MEDRLYCDSPYLKEWQAEITSVAEKDGKFIITLDRTAFYPGGGGQPSDRGVICDIAVEDVYEEQNQTYHVLASRPAEKSVSCKLDFERRLDYMQQHTGQHLLSAILFDKYDWKTSSLHMSEEEVSVDVSVTEIPDEVLIAIEDEVNDHIYLNLPIKTHIVGPEEAAKFPLRKVPPRADLIRIVEIETTDFSPCCGTHVTRTGEIGIVKVMRSEKRGNETRVHFLCGKRAFKEFQREHQSISGLMRLYRTTEDKVLQRAEETSLQLRDTQKEMAVLKNASLSIEGKELAQSANSGIVERSFESYHFDDLNTLSQEILKNGDLIVILSSIPDKRLLFAHSGKFDINCGKVLKEQLQAFNGKGGGKDKWANAGFANVDDMKRFIVFLKDLVSSRGRLMQ
jgi:alanyl-tRNA synthetase